MDKRRLEVMSRETFKISRRLITRGDMEVLRVEAPEKLKREVQQRNPRACKDMEGLECTVHLRFQIEREVGYIGGSLELKKSKGCREDILCTFCTCAGVV